MYTKHRVVLVAFNSAAKEKPLSSPLAMQNTMEATMISLMLQGMLRAVASWWRDTGEACRLASTECGEHLLHGWDAQEEESRGNEIVVERRAKIREKALQEELHSQRRSNGNAQRQTSRRPLRAALISEL